MRRRGKKNLGQMTGEYALLLFVVIGAITSMTIYLKRLLQARIRDSRQSMIATIANYRYTDPASGGVYGYNGSIYKEYEPYYGNRYSDVQIVENDNRILTQGLTTGISRQNIDHTTWSKTQSDQLPPGRSD